MHKINKGGNLIREWILFLGTVCQIVYNMMLFHCMVWTCLLARSCFPNFRSEDKNKQSGEKNIFDIIAFTKHLLTHLTGNH